MPKAPTLASQKKLVERFNARYKVGDKMKVEQDSGLILEWIEHIIAQCRQYGIPVFVKQLGTHLAKQMGLQDRHGGDESEWPAHLQIREFPENHITG